MVPRSRVTSSRMRALSPGILSRSELGPSALMALVTNSETSSAASSIAAAAGGGLARASWSAVQRLADLTAEGSAASSMPAQRAEAAARTSGGAGAQGGGSSGGDASSSGDAATAVSPGDVYITSHFRRSLKHKQEISSGAYRAPVSPH